MTLAHLAVLLFVPAIPLEQTKATVPGENVWFIGVFLALLELIREKKILVEQGEDLGEVTITSAPPEHRATYAHASLHLSDEAAAEDAQPAVSVTDEELNAVLAASSLPRETE